MERFQSPLQAKLFWKFLVLFLVFSLLSFGTLFIHVVRVLVVDPFQKVHSRVFTERSFTRVKVGFETLEEF